MINDATDKKRFKLLFVDDDPAIVKFLSFVFRDSKYVLKDAADGQSGFEIAKKFMPDLIISDVILPELDGFAFCKKIRCNESLKNIIFLLITSIKMASEDAVKGLESGADEYILKPLEQEQIKVKVDALLRIKTLQDRLIRNNKVLTDTNRELENHKQLLEETNQTLEREKERLGNSLKEISHLMEELEKSHQHQVQLNQSLKKNFDELVNLLTTVVKLRSPYYRGHAREVSKISLFIADRLELNVAQEKDLNVAALLHEIGMLGLPDKITKKRPDELTEDEQQTVNQYPLVGESLLKGFSGFQTVATIIRHINENIDGTGYPDGLSGEDIPIASRIIRVAATFNRLIYNLTEPGEIYGTCNALKDEIDLNYDGRVMVSLKEYVDSIADRRKNRKVDIVDVTGLKPGMVLAADLYTATGIKLMPEGTELTDVAIKGILNYSYSDSLQQEIKILLQ